MYLNLDVLKPKSSPDQSSYKAGFSYFKTVVYWSYGGSVGHFVPD